MSWIEVQATFKQAPEDWSPFIDVFLRYGIENTLQTDRPPTLTACVVEVEGAASTLESLREDLLQAGVASIETRPYQEQNWEEAWKRFFHPRRVGERFVIRPTWEEFAARPDDRVIVLDPGQAFGTGDHPTTRMCLALLEQVPVEGARVLDVGCGSGILSVGVVLLGAAYVTAVDIEPLAVEVARENATLNGVAFDAAVSDGVPQAAEGTQVDLVLSNIISAALIRIAPDVAAVVKPGGYWIVSGILEQNWSDVYEVAERQGFNLVEKREDDGWVAATFRH